MNYVTIAELNLTIKRNIYKIPNDIGLVVGIPRSGLLAASIIGLHLNVPISTLQEYKCGLAPKIGETRSSQSGGQKILIVDDSVRSGSAIRKAKEYLTETEERLIWCSVFATGQGKSFVDIYLEEVPLPRVFEWNLIHRPETKRYAFDIDGVLCHDPTPEDCLDEKKYRNFVLNAKILSKPTYPIGFIVTNRLEKYRNETELWLRRNDIKYHQLLMRNTKEEYKSNSEFKSLIYSKITAILFIESEQKQAEAIHFKTGKPVVTYIGSHFYVKRDLATKVETFLKRKLRKTIKTAVLAFFKIRDSQRK